MTSEHSQKTRGLFSKSQTTCILRKWEELTVFWLYFVSQVKWRCSMYNVFDLYIRYMPGIYVYNSVETNINSLIHMKTTELYEGVQRSLFVVLIRDSVC